MIEVLNALTPIYVGFFCGILLRQLGIFSEQFAKDMLKLVFYLLAPAFILQAISKISLEIELLAFLSGGVTFLVVGYLIARSRPDFKAMATQTRAVAITTSMTINTYYLIPFVQALFGDEGIAKWAAYDFGGSLLTYSWVYIISAQYGTAETLNYKNIVTKLVKAPPLYALLIGLSINIAGVELPTVMTQTATSIGSVTGTVTIVALGMLFTPRFTNLYASLKILVPRFVLGATLACLFALAFNLGQPDFALLLMIMTAPVAFLTIVYAALEDLDLDCAVRTVSLSLMLGVPVTSAIAFLLL